MMSPERRRAAMLRIGLAFWRDPDATEELLKQLVQYSLTDPETDEVPQRYLGVSSSITEKLWSMFPEPERGRDGQPLKVTRTDLAALLADYEISNEKGMGKDEYLRRIAANGWNFGAPYHHGIWTNRETVWGHLRKARRLRGSSPTFRQSVEIEKWLRRQGWIVGDYVTLK